MLDATTAQSIKEIIDLNNEQIKVLQAQNERLQKFLVVSE